MYARLRERGAVVGEAREATATLPHAVLTTPAPATLKHYTRPRTLQPHAPRGDALLFIAATTPPHTLTHAAPLNHQYK
ncbi:hypothetical protein E2C01_099026 [Portunus trituberculatus]|uniref:Uncharacterized protein n=1 Tax=Portunus trituberculatus TaxID=210409 RepID=A0A5B7KEC3_PORTR|nr:hypothetical protein [Portunus trituberculatus]